jgi:hypothetical protein
MGAAESSQLTTRPSFERAISPAFSRTCKCFMKPGSDMSCALASSVTGRLSPESDSSTRRRVGSASAANTVSSASSEYLTIWFSIGDPRSLVKPSLVGVSMERVKGIEPSYAAWEAAVLPLNYTRAAKIV